MKVQPTKRPYRRVSILFITSLALFSHLAIASGENSPERVLAECLAEKASTKSGMEKLASIFSSADDMDAACEEEFTRALRLEIDTDYSASKMTDAEYRTRLREMIRSRQLTAVESGDPALNTKNISPISVQQITDATTSNKRKVIETADGYTTTSGTGQ